MQSYYWVYMKHSIENSRNAIAFIEIMLAKKDTSVFVRYICCGYYFIYYQIVAQCAMLVSISRDNCINFDLCIVGVVQFV